jgi:outer membrane protein assembly factor BamB
MTRRVPMKITPLLSCCAILSVLSLRAEDSWPEFRGPTGQGHADAKGLPLRWSETQNVVWKTELPGKGWSTPVILGSQIWMTTATEEGTELFVLMVDRETGKLVRNHKLFSVEKPQYADKSNSYASPSATIEPGRVYVTFGSPGTACLDTATGKVLWERRDLECNHWRGAGSSPILWRDLLIMHFDGADRQYVVALDKQTGRTVWQTARSIDFKDLTPDGKPTRDGDFRKAFSTPLVIEHDGKPQLISVGSMATYAYEPATGKEIWRVEERKHHSGTVRPVVGHGMVFTATGLAKGDLWAVKLGGSGVITDTHIAWKASTSIPNRPSPILVGDLLFMVHQDTGVASCLDAKTGETVWRERLPGPGHVSSSPVHADGKLYFFNENGFGVVVAATRDFRVLAENKLDGSFKASVAIAGKAIYARTKTHLYRLEEK